MPRRNKRRQEREHAADDARFLGDDYRFTRDPELAAQRKENRRKRREEAAARMAENQRKLFASCVVPGCKFQTLKVLIDEIEFPICSLHAAAVWESVERQDKNPDIAAAKGALAARRDAMRATREEAWEREDALYREDLKAGRIVGDIYFVRIGQLVKVGWSSNLAKRLKQYGASAEMLCHYPGTREDETTLHRQLRPALAKGREWYHDGDVIAAFIAEALSTYGEPSVKPIWTEHKDVIRARR